MCGPGPRARLPRVRGERIQPEEDIGRFQPTARQHSVADAESAAVLGVSVEQVMMASCAEVGVPGPVLNACDVGVVRKRVGGRNGPETTDDALHLRGDTRERGYSRTSLWTPSPVSSRPVRRARVGWRSVAHRPRRWGPRST